MRRNRKAPADRLVARYLAELDQAVATLPRERRRQIVDEIAGHIADGRAGLDHEGPMAIEALLARVGDPRAIAAEAGAHDVASRPAARGDGLVPWLLLFGAFVFAVGWFVGVGLLWTSPTWRRVDKLLGTLVLPGGLALAFAFLGLPTAAPVCTTSGAPGLRAVTHCTTAGFVLPFPAGLLALVLAVLAPVLTAVHLQRVRHRSDVDGLAHGAW